MVEENISQEFRLKNLDNTRFIFLKKWSEINRWVKSTKTLVQP